MPACYVKDHLNGSPIILQNNKNNSVNKMKKKKYARYLHGPAGRAVLLRLPNMRALPASEVYTPYLNGKLCCA